MDQRIKIEKIINPAIYFLLISGVILLAGNKNWWPAFYAPNFFGWAFLISVFLIFLPRLIFTAQDQCQRETLILLRAVLALTLVSNALGEIYLYQLFQYGFQYDKVIHFLNSSMYLIVLASFINSWYKIPLKKALMAGVILVIAGGIAWEFLEFTVDIIFKTKEFGVNGQDVVADTTFDLISDLAGITAGYLFLRRPKLAQRIINDSCRADMMSA